MAACSSQRFYLPHHHPTPPHVMHFPCFIDLIVPRPKHSGTQVIWLLCFTNCRVREVIRLGKERSSVCIPVSSSGGFRFESRPEVNYPELCVVFMLSTGTARDVYTGQRYHIQGFQFYVKYSAVN